MSENGKGQPPKFSTGQMVIIYPVRQNSASPRDSAIEPYAGKTAVIEDYYYLYNEDNRRVFYIYTVKLSSDEKLQLVAHEDELKPVIE